MSSGEVGPGTRDHVRALTGFTDEQIFEALVHLGPEFSMRLRAALAGPRSTAGVHGPGCRVQVLDQGPEVLPTLAIQCRGCPAEETMNDEDGGCDLADLARWQQDHHCAGGSRP